MAQEQRHQKIKKPEMLKALKIELMDAIKTQDIHRVDKILGKTKGLNLDFKYEYLTE